MALLTRVLLLAAAALLQPGLSVPAAAALPAFPGAEGYGAETAGGRGGQVIAVTTLADSGPGSLREALLTPGPRIVVFRVGGTITLLSDIDVSGPARSFLTIAGQTAPGDGIQVRGWGLLFQDGVHDVVIRHLRLRPGHTAPEDWSKAAITIYGATLAQTVSNVFVDHCSLYWGPDETVGIWDYVHDVTVQWSTFEGMEHLFPGVRSERSKSILAGAPLANGAHQHNVTVHHNFMANTQARNPQLAADGPYHVVNNLVYNWAYFGTSIDDWGTGVRANLIGNVYRQGPVTSVARYAVGMGGGLLQPDGMVYVADNLGPYRPDGTFDEWAIVGWGHGPDSTYWEIPAPTSKRRLTPWAPSPVPVTVQPATTLPAVLLPAVGAQPRDALDLRLVTDFVNGTGSIKEASDFASFDYPVLQGGTPPADGDGDGMPDAWESANGFDPGDPADGPQDADGDGYTNVAAALRLATPEPVSISRSPSRPRTCQMLQRSNRWTCGSHNNAMPSPIRAG